MRNAHEDTGCTITGPDRGHRADERGWVVFPFEDIESAAEPPTAHIVQVLPGHTRGNHYHTLATEWLVHLSGSGLLQWRNPDDEAVHETRFEKPGTRAEIRPGTRHRLVNDTEGELVIFAVRGGADGDVTVRESF